MHQNQFANYTKLGKGVGSENVAEKHQSRLGFDDVADEM